MALDAKSKAVDLSERFKMALVSADPNFWLGRLYPGRPQEREEEEFDMDDTTGEWNFPPVSEEEIRSLDEMLREKGGVLTYEDMEDDDEGVWE